MNYNMLEPRVDLTEKQLQVFLLSIHKYNHSQLYSILTKDEKEKADKIKIKLKKQQFIVARGMLRKIISTGIEESTADIQIFTSQHGKPFIKTKYNHVAIEFNLSHSEQMVLIAMTLKNKVGVDIEKIDSTIKHIALAKRFFSKQEYEYLSNIPVDKQSDTFYRIWSRKEALIKATGKKLTSGLNDFSVCADDGFASVIELPSEWARGGKWYSFEPIHIGAYKTALVSDNKNIEIVSHLYI